MIVDWDPTALVLPPADHYEPADETGPATVEIKCSVISGPADVFNRDSEPPEHIRH